MLIFDRSIGALMPDSESRLLIYHIVAAIYLTLKVENRAAKMTFDFFVEKISPLPAFQTLQRHLSPGMPMKWDGSFYPILEKEMLTKALRWKTNFTTPAHLIFLIVCVFKQ